MKWIAIAITVGAATLGCHRSPSGVRAFSVHAEEPCPLGVEGAKIAVEDVDGGVDVTITSSPDRVAELRRRVRDAAKLHGPGAHEGMGHDGEHLGHQRHGLRLTSLPPVTTSVEDVDGGARLRLAALVPDEVDRLRERIRDNVSFVTSGPCN
ncbi:MAG TPA: hypothetical protein VHB21_13170 [Minicystis sp.]|nr:hypothetical protein [Minicystis sp.]